MLRSAQHTEVHARMALDKQAMKNTPNVEQEFSSLMLSHQYESPDQSQKCCLVMYLARQQVMGQPSSLAG